MKFTRHFTKPNTPIEDQIKWKITSSKITAANGDVIFNMDNIEVPDHWSQQAVNIIVQKFFRKAGVSIARIQVEEDNIPSWLWKSIPIEAGNGFTYSSEISAKQVFHRLAGAWTYWGWREGIFKLDPDPVAKDYQISENKIAEKHARIFYDEIYYMLAMQIASPNSPQWFNTGLHWAYGITGDESGQWAVDDKGQPYETKNAYERPQSSACFIQPVKDDLVAPGGIMDLFTKEVRLFKQGSGAGTNFSNIRGKGEKLSGGGVSSGLISFLRIGDVAAGSIASGGTTRRAALMRCLDLDHPEIEDFIEWKMKEESKAASLYLGSKILNKSSELYDESLFNNDPKLQPIMDRLKIGIDAPICDLNFEGEAINTVSGQNANNSIRITDEFLQKVDNRGNWPLIARTNGKIVKILKPEELWNKICRAAWACADPGLQFHDTINEWHTCKTDGNINASNPCSEYMFLDDTACNLASLNLGKFLLNGEFQTKSFIHATYLWTIVLEISVYMASFPSREIARNSYLYRTLGLGYANLGGILMRKGLSYDSDEGRNLAASITALMHGVAYQTSAEMAEELSPFERWKVNAISMQDVLTFHYDSVKQLIFNGPSKLIAEKALTIWQNMSLKSFRNAQVTLLAPTGTIALLMDCDTTGIEPDFSLVKYKSLAGGGLMKIVNECVPESLKTLGYTQAQIQSIIQHIKENDTIEGWIVNGQPMPEEHLAVFDCAVPGGNGTRSLRPMAHVEMVATVQPFLSGAVSKTVNLPNSATIEDVSFIYREAHRLGLKAIALYRDGSKLTQPLNTKRETIPTTPHSDPKHNHNFNLDEVKEIVNNTIESWKNPEPTFKTICINCNRNEDTSFTCLGSNNPLCVYFKDHSKLKLPPRQPLPMRRAGYTQKIRIDGQSIYLHTGEYPSGNLGEIFIEWSREGSTVRALINAFSKAVSIGIQYGVPLSEFIDAFVYTKFEPAGIVEGHDKIKLGTSILDVIFRDLAIHYLRQNEFANVNIEDENMLPVKERLELDQLISQSIELYNKMTNEEKEELHNMQRESWVKGEMALGLDKDEEEWVKNNLNTKNETLPAFVEIVEKIQIKSKSYTGDSCPRCHHQTLIKTGTCTTCSTCEYNTGCS